MTKHHPRAGERLAHLLSLSTQIETQINRLLANETEEEAAKFDEFLATIPNEVGPDPDAYQVILAKLTQLAEAAQTASDLLAERAFVASGAIFTLEQQIHNWIKPLIMEGQDRGQIVGSTWTYELSKDEPRVVIDPKQLPDGFAKFTRVPDEELIAQMLRQGERVAGADLVPQFKLTAKVNKKVSQ